MSDPQNGESYNTTPEHIAAVSKFHDIYDDPITGETVDNMGYNLDTAKNAFKTAISELEAEIESYSAFGIMDTITLDMVIGWIDRQAAITEQEIEHDLMLAGRMAVEVERKRIAELTAEREQYRTLFGMALDWAHEITMLESSIDEGMA